MVMNKNLFGVDLSLLVSAVAKFAETLAPRAVPFVPFQRADSLVVAAQGASWVSMIDTAATAVLTHITVQFVLRMNS